MTQHYEVVPLTDVIESTVFVPPKHDCVMVTFSADGLQTTAHMSAESATKLAWAILRGAEFVRHKQAEVV